MRNGSKIRSKSGRNQVDQVKKGLGTGLSSCSQVAGGLEIGTPSGCTLPVSIADDLEIYCLGQAHARTISDPFRLYNIYVPVSLSEGGGPPPYGW